MRGGEIWRCDSYTSRSRLLMVKNLCRLFSVIRYLRIATLKGRLHRCNSPEGLRQTPPIPWIEASVDPIHAVGLGRISLRLFRRHSRYPTRCRQRFSLSCTGVFRLMHRPFSYFIECCIRANTPVTPDIVETVLWIMPRIWLHWRQKKRFSRVGRNPGLILVWIYCCLGFSRTCWTVSMTHLRNTFLVLQAVSHFRSFFSNICSSFTVFCLSLGRNSFSMLQKRCHIICVLSVCPIWETQMKSSRYTLTCASYSARACREWVSKAASASCAIVMS